MELSFKSFILRERARLAPSERPPTIADAKVAAEALLDAGVNQVWLYGSVARGEAHHNSDIDLVAVVDDLNYRRRPHRCMKLVRVAEDACHYRVEINLTDHPEWRIQRHRVSCSFMTAISCDLKLLAYSTARCVSVNWNKQQVAPTSNAELAIDRLGNVWTSLAKIDASLYPLTFGGEVPRTRRPQRLHRDSGWSPDSDLRSGQHGHREHSQGTEH